MKIDFIILWVDGDDPTWQKQKDTYSNQITGREGSASRYRDVNTLKYVLRAIEKNCPWYNKIHIITCGHKPEWLNTNHPKINLITHKEMYFDKSHLPVFNSSSIEMNLPNLQGISEQFVYLNDDMLIMKKTPINRFFHNNIPVDFLSHGWIPRNKLFKRIRGMDPWVHSLVNNLNLVNKKLRPLNYDSNYLYHHSYSLKTRVSNFFLQRIFKRIIWIEHWHHPQPYLMTTLKDVYKAFPEDMMVCSRNKFRSNNDLTQYLYRYWHLAKNEYSPHQYNDGIAINISTEKQLKGVIALIKNNDSINFVCFNDSDDISNEEYIIIKDLLTDYLDENFNKPASFEI